MTPYDPQKHHRRSIRLRGWDYRNPGWYFVTLVVQNRECLFGRVLNGKMVLNEYGKICNQCWLDIPEHFENVTLDEYQIMPNHMHGIIVIQPNGNDVGARHAVPLPHAVPLQSEQPIREFGKPIPKSLSTIIGSFRSAVTNRINKYRQTPGAKLWQRNYGECHAFRHWEHIIRDENELNRIRRYIKNNPLKWTDDDYFEKM